MADTRIAQRQKVVVVHRGARDEYQVAAALAEAGILERLVTDLYWQGDQWWARALASALPAGLRRGFHHRYHPGLHSALVAQSFFSGFASFLLERVKQAPYDWRRRAIRRTDARLGRRAGKLARRTNALLLSYSYYGFEGFKSNGQPGVLFQLHPHPLSVRRLLTRELTEHPDCAVSLEREWELSLPEDDFDRLVEETRMAHWFLTASSFTRNTLIENGAAPELIRVVPYGVDLDRFTPPVDPPTLSGPLRLLFVGTINQRKGIKYLLQALRLLHRYRDVELIVCGRAVDDLALFESFEKQVTLCISATPAELQAAYQVADLFVLPSVAEGFGHVLLEALASGVPILSTSHTAAPDLITNHGCEGWVVEPRRPDLLAARIEWALGHRHELAAMRRAARERAEFFTWGRFRSGVVDAVRRFLAPGAGEETDLRCRNGASD